MAAPVKQTCPDIDKYIKYIKMVTMKSRDIQNASHDDLKDYTEAMNDELNNCIDYFEEIRKSNSSLRDWGEQLESELEEAATQINDLENKIEHLKEQEA